MMHLSSTILQGRILGRDPQPKKHPAIISKVTLVGQPQLKKWLKRHPVTFDEVEQKLARERIDA